MLICRCLLFSRRRSSALSLSRGPINRESSDVTVLVEMGCLANAAAEASHIAGLTVGRWGFSCTSGFSAIRFEFRRIGTGGGPERSDGGVISGVCCELPEPDEASEHIEPYVEPAGRAGAGKQVARRWILWGIIRNSARATSDDVE